MTQNILLSTNQEQNLYIMKKKLFILVLCMSSLCYTQVNKVGTLLGQNNQLSLPPGGLNTTYSLTPLNNYVYFNARTDQPNQGKELYKSNGVTNNVSIVKDINNSVNNYSGNPANFFYRSFSNEIFFSADDAPNPSNFELWKTDGTASGTVKVHEFNANGSSNPKRITEFNNIIFFAVTGTNTGEELGYSDGTSIGSGIIEIVSGTSGGEPQNFREFNGELYFSANTPIGRELWKTDGTVIGTVLVKDINTSGSSNPEELIVFDNKLYFVADNGVNGKELWKTDGTTLGTQLVSDLNPGLTGSNPNNLTLFKGRLFISAITANTGREIFTVLQGGGAITLFRDIVAGTTGCNAEKFFHYPTQNILLFVAGNGNTNKELWYTNGSLVFTNQLKDINPGSTSSGINFAGANFVEYNGKVYFTADDGTNGYELWTTDGTTSGTQRISDIGSNSLSSNPRALVVANNFLLFIAKDFNGYELWKYNDPTLSNNEITFDTTFKLFPNPTNTSFKIESKVIINSVDVYNLQGKLVKSFKNNLDNYDINSLSSSVYFVKIISDTGLVTKKLIKD